MESRRRRPLVVDEERLLDVLAQAQAQGFLGAHVPLIDHLANGFGFTDIITRERTATVVDLGSGGGVPALVIAAAIPTVRITLVERGTKRARFLVDAVHALELESRVEVIADDAEVAARHPRFTEQTDVVTARSFGPPAVTAEAACRFLRVGGRLIVSEPPRDADVANDEAPDATCRPKSIDLGLAADRSQRWPESRLAPTGLVPTDRVQLGGSNFQVLHRRGSIESQLPRRSATTRKRPLFTVTSPPDHDPSPP